jgi:hypothetical protein
MKRQSRALRGSKGVWEWENDGIFLSHCSWFGIIVISSYGFVFYVLRERNLLFFLIKFGIFMLISYFVSIDCVFKL